MNRTQFVQRIAAEMRKRDLRKYVSSRKNVFHISDDYGNKKDFVVKETNKTVMYTADDVEAVVNTALDVIMDALMHGEKITIQGFGSFGFRLMHFGKKRDINTGEMCELPPRYVARFTQGNDMKRCARAYSQLKEEEEFLAEHGDASYRDGDGDE